MVWVPRRGFQRLRPERPTPERCVEVAAIEVDVVFAFLPVDA